MPPETKSEALSRSLKPVCPRENHELRYEEKGISWMEESDHVRTVACYHCGYFGCSVRYTPGEGYFTVIDTPNLPNFVEEPGANILQCPRHGTWLYRFRKEGENSGFGWRCGVDGCDYVHADVEGQWFRPSELV